MAVAYRDPVFYAKDIGEKSSGVIRNGGDT